MLETQLQQKEKECTDLKKQIDILRNLAVGYSTVIRDEITDVSQSLKTKVTLLRLQKQYGTDFFSVDTFKQHSGVPSKKTFYEEKPKSKSTKSCLYPLPPIDEMSDGYLPESDPSNESIEATTVVQAPPCPAPQFPIALAQQNQSTKNEVVSTHHVTVDTDSRSHFMQYQQSRPVTSPLYLVHSKNGVHHDYGQKYNDMNLTGNLQRFMQYNNVRRNYSHEMGTALQSERGKTWNLKDKTVTHPDLRGSQNAVHEISPMEKSAYLRTDVGAVTNFLSQDVNDPVFSKQSTSWEASHGKTSLNHHIV